MCAQFVKTLTLLPAHFLPASINPTFDIFQCVFGVFFEWFSFDLRFEDSIDAFFVEELAEVFRFSERRTD